MKKIAIFASGSGSNAQAIAEYFMNLTSARIECILSNKTDAYVLERAKKLNIPAYSFNRESYKNTQEILHLLQKHQIDFIVLAGFLWLIPKYLVDAYPSAIINIHPALLPKYGGKGMFGMRVHEAILQNNEIESGITIHYVNENYDEGNIIFQAKCKIAKDDTPDSLAERIHKLEHQHYPKVIEELIKKLPGQIIL